MENNVPIAAVNLPVARIETVIAQRKAIMEAVKNAMKEGVHYGKVPGVDKPGCFKPGAEVLCLVFGLRPQFQEAVKELEGGHIECVYTCSLYSPEGQIMGQGVGSCSTLESKYRYRNSALRCPACGKEAIIKGKAEYGGGWLCFAKKGGCGAKFKDGDQAIEGQVRGKVENPDVADQRNTCRKMAKKRAHVDAALTTTGASEFFTQDIEDMPEFVTTEKQPELRSPEPEQSPYVKAQERNAETYKELEPKLRAEYLQKIKDLLNKTFKGPGAKEKRAKVMAGLGFESWEEVEKLQTHDLLDLVNMVRDEVDPPSDLRIDGEKDLAAVGGPVNDDQLELNYRGYTEKD